MCLLVSRQTINSWTVFVFEDHHPATVPAAVQFLSASPAGSPLFAALLPASNVFSVALNPGFCLSASFLPRPVRARDLMFSLFVIMSAFSLYCCFMRKSRLFLLIVDPLYVIYAKCLHFYCTLPGSGHAYTQSFSHTCRAAELDFCLNLA